MNKKVAVYGFSEEMFAKLKAEVSEGYILRQVDNAIALIGTHGICSIVYSEGMDIKSRELLDNFYLDVGENADEQVIWIDSQSRPNVLEGIYFHYSNLSELLPEVDKVLERAQKHYTVQQMYCGAYAFLDKNGIEEMLEEELRDARYDKYGKMQNPEVFKRVRQEWTALLEVDAITEMAAVYEFAAWLKHNKHPCRLSGTAVSGLIPYLLGIHEVNPLPPHLHCPECQKVIWRGDYKDGFDIPPKICPDCGGLMRGDGHNLVWQEYASYGRVPSYVFHLPVDMQPLITDWLDNHWLRKHMGKYWEDAQPYEDHLVRGNMHFLFDLDNEKSQAVEELPSLCREDIYFYLKKHGFVDKDAFRGMCSVRKGRGFPVITDEMRASEDSWILEKCEKVTWLPSKANLLQEMIYRMKSRIKEEVI